MQIPYADTTDDLLRHARRVRAALQTERDHYIARGQLGLVAKLNNEIDAVADAIKALGGNAHTAIS